jgi:Taurine catabolism dioxygenase TauD, TfdA family
LQLIAIAEKLSTENMSTLLSQTPLPAMSPMGNQALPPGAIQGPAAWYGPAMDLKRDWLIRLDANELAEIDDAVREHRDAGRDMGDISAASFKLPYLGQKLREIQQQVLHGHGFVMLRGFKVDERSLEDSAIAYLGIGAHFGSFRSQNAKGHLLGHVRDLGLDINNPNVRYYQTNRALNYHTDSCDIVGLLCLKTSKSGGESRLVSSVTLHNEILQRRPDLWAVLFNTFPTDRRGEVPPGMEPWFEIPVFNWHAGELSTIYAGQYVRSAQALFPKARRLNALETEAIDFLDALADDDELALSMDFQPGDMQFVHNHQILHSRTDFENWPEPERQRHLFRLWLAPPKARELPPVYKLRYGSIEPGNRGGIITQNTKLTFSIEP